MKYLDRYYSLIGSPCFKSSLVETDLFIVIPAFKENISNIIETIDSVCQSHINSQDINFEIVVLINHHSDHDQQIHTASLQMHKDLKLLYKDKSNIHISYEIFIGKNRGVGYARKRLMDAAFSYFYNKRKDGIIVNLDADCIVNNTYLKAIISYFEKNTKIEAASIAFEHQLTQNDIAIIMYEIHLRYFMIMQKLLGVPFAHQTIGSAMAVRAYAYAKEGGMVNRQAGEDFYFLHKYTKKQTLGDIKTAIVYPSGRISDRVPFGTGKAVGTIVEKSHQYKTYSPKSFIILEQFFKLITKVKSEGITIILHKISVLDKNLIEFLVNNNYEKSLINIDQNTSTHEAFIKRFYYWFDAFKLMKYLHFMRDKGISDISVQNAAKYLLNRLGIKAYIEDIYKNLEALRLYDTQN